MAFTGTPVVTKVAVDLFRITGLSLAGSAAGTIGLVGAGDVKLLDCVEWIPQDAVTLQDCIQVEIVPTTVAPVTIGVVKTGTTQDDFVATLTNLDSDVASGNVEIYVRFRV